MQTTLTSKGRVTIPRDIRQYFGLKQGMVMTCEVAGDHIALRPVRVPLQGQTNGFGLITSRRKGVRADIDETSLDRAARCDV